MKLRASDALRGAALWAGSLLEQQEKYGGLTRAFLIERRDMLARCDDRTPRENRLLRLLEAELQRPEFAR